MQDLQHELSHLSGQLETVQKVSRTHELSNKSNLDDINIQNNSLLKELDEVNILYHYLHSSVLLVSQCLTWILYFMNGISVQSVPQKDFFECICMPIRGV